MLVLLALRKRVPYGRSYCPDTLPIALMASSIPDSLQDLYAQLDEELVSPVEMLFSESVEDRLVGVVNLQHLCDEQSVPFLISALSDSSEDVVFTAVTSLWEIANQQAVVPLLQCLELHHDVKVRNEALMALKELVNQDHLLILLDKFSLNDSCLDRAILILLRKIHDIQALPSIAPFLESSDDQLRYEAIITLRYLNQLTHFPPALTLASDPNVEVRKETMLTLAHLDEPDVLNLLMSAVTSDESWEVRRNAAQSLERKSDQQSSDALVQAIGDEHWQVRKFSLRALKPLVQEPYVPAIVPLLCDDYSDVRKEAALVLGGVISEQAKTALQQGLNDSDIEVRIASQKSLAKMAV